MKLFQKIKNLFRKDSEEEFFMKCPCCHNYQSSLKGLTFKNVTVCKRCGGFFDNNFAKKFTRDEYLHKIIIHEKVMKKRNKLKKNRMSIMDSTIVIYGENHNEYDLVTKIREAIVELNPSVILHELYPSDKNYYEKYLPNTVFEPLENEYTQELETMSLKDQFEVREQSMINHLNEAIKQYERIAVVVGDTHLRTIETDELGEQSPINNWAKNHDAIIVRSPYKEIK